MSGSGVVAFSVLTNKCCMYFYSLGAAKNQLSQYVGVCNENKIVVNLDFK